MLERLTFVIGCKYCQFFLQVSALLYSFPRNSLPNTQIWMTIVCQLFFQLKVISREKSGKVSSQLNSHYHQASVMAEVLYAYISLHHTIWKGCLLKSQSLIKLVIFTAASSKTLVSQTGQVILFSLCVFTVSMWWWRTQWLLVWFGATTLIRAKVSAFYPQLLWHHQCKCQQSEKDK